MHKPPRWRNDDDGRRLNREQLRNRFLQKAQDAEAETAVFGMRFLDACLYRYCAQDAAQFEEIWAEYCS